MEQLSIREVIKISQIPLKLKTSKSRKYLIFGRIDKKPYSSNTTVDGDQYRGQSAEDRRWRNAVL